MENEKHRECAYAVFRVLIGLLFAQHGAQKLLGWFTEKEAITLFSKMGLAGTIELVGGLLIAVGLFTTWTAVVSGIEMLAAYFTVHTPQGWIPITNRGELALLYFAAFLVVATQGPGPWSLDRKLLKR